MRRQAELLAMRPAQCDEITMEKDRISRLNPSSYRRTPWKNGGGVTVDIADAYAPGAEPGSWTGMLWRLGRTQIVTPEPFSDLSGFDRILTVIGGRGLVLEIEGSTALDVREPFRPVRFRGEDKIMSRLEAGPVAVLNLIADREHTIDVAILRGGETHALSAAINIAYALEDSVVGEHALKADEALRIDGAGGELGVSSGRVALAMISA
jgi:environmental stress-induced protein Ves